MFILSHMCPLYTNLVIKINANCAEIYTPRHMPAWPQARSTQRATHPDTHSMQTEHGDPGPVHHVTLHPDTTTWMCKSPPAVLCCEMHGHVHCIGRMSRDMCHLTEVLMLPDGDTNITYIIMHMYHAQTPTQVHWVPVLSQAWRCTDFILKAYTGLLLGLDIRSPNFHGASSLEG